MLGNKALRCSGGWFIVADVQMFCLAVNPQTGQRLAVVYRAIGAIYAEVDLSGWLFRLSVKETI
jgi:hypothetical protein